MEKKPLFSIIVVSLDAEKTIRPTIDSVLGQTFADYEIIVKDALSSDGTLRMVPSDPRIKVLSCRDRSIYEGMNQAIEKASGSYLFFLNCGDRLHDEGVLKAMADFLSRFGADNLRIAYGDYSSKGLVRRQQPHVSDSYFVWRGLCHQSMFFGSAVFDKMGGGYDASYRMLADYDLSIRACRSGIPFNHVGIIVSDYLGDGFSTKNPKLHREELLRLRKAHLTLPERFEYHVKLVLTGYHLRMLLLSDKSPLWIRRMVNRFCNFVNKARR